MTHLDERRLHLPCDALTGKALGMRALQRMIAANRNHGKRVKDCGQGFEWLQGMEFPRRLAAAATTVLLSRGFHWRPLAARLARLERLRQGQKAGDKWGNMTPQLLCCQ